VFEAFQQNFTPDPNALPDVDGSLPELGIPGLSELIARFGGGSFNGGLYRIVRASDIDAWNARVSLGFPEFAERITCFGYDWLGRAFAADAARQEQGQPAVLLFEPGTGEALAVPANIQTFHDVELIQNSDRALASNAYDEWLARKGAVPAYAECIGYKVPLFLNGEDTFENMELSDLEVYWHLMGQLIAKTTKLRPGTKVGPVTIEE
jgi:T6SS immunity protein Tdi1, C-terminal